MEELDLVSTLKVIVSKLPFKLREKWRTTAYELMKKTRFSHLVTFIENQAHILQDPVFGDINESMPKKAIPKGHMTADTKQQTKQKARSSNFAVAIGMKDKIADQERDGESENQKACYICHLGKHSLDNCEMLKAQPHNIKVKLLNDMPALSR